MNAYRQIEVFSDIIALDLGIVHPKISAAPRDERPKSIDEALKSMTKDESSRCRRKFRKILRAIASKKRICRMSRASKRLEVMMDIRNRAWSVVAAKHNYELADNDE
jgi:hypothetical protein